MRVGAGKAAKTNVGAAIQNAENLSEVGFPSLSERHVETGRIVDIRTPGDPVKKEGRGLLVRLEFDNPRFQLNGWVPLNTEYQTLLNSVGDSNAVRKSRPRISYNFHPSRPENGYAELMCDNRQEEQFTSYEKNQSSAFINVINGLATGAMAPI